MFENGRNLPLLYLRLPFQEQVGIVDRIDQIAELFDRQRPKDPLRLLQFGESNQRMRVDFPALKRIGKQLAEGRDVAVHRGWLDLPLPSRDVAVEVLALEFVQGNVLQQGVEALEREPIAAQGAQSRFAILLEKTLVETQDRPDRAILTGELPLELLPGAVQDAGLHPSFEAPVCFGNWGRTF